MTISFFFVIYVNSQRTKILLYDFGKCLRTFLQNLKHSCIYFIGHFLFSYRLSNNDTLDNAILIVSI